MNSYMYVNSHIWHEMEGDILYNIVLRRQRMMIHYMILLAALQKLHRNTSYLQRMWFLNEIGKTVDL